MILSPALLHLPRHFTIIFRTQQTNHHKKRTHNHKPFHFRPKLIRIPPALGAPQPVDLKAVLASNKEFQNEIKRQHYYRRTDEQREKTKRIDWERRARKKLERDLRKALDE